MNQFLLETLVDFPDDALRAPFPITERHIDSMMAALSEAGVQRVSWATYADGHGGFFLPTGITDRRNAAAYDNWEAYGRTLQALGNPLRVATEAAHRHGMQMYGYFKPYETGPGLVLPEGSPEARDWGRLEHVGGRLAWIDPFVVKHPHLRIKRRADDLPPGGKDAPIHAIKLIKKDDSATRIKREHLQIWSSPNNYRYRPLDVRFDLAESIETAPRDKLDLNDKIVTRKGDRVRALTLSGFRLLDPYLLVTTTFADGPADFENICPDMMIALDERGREVPGVFANGTAIWGDKRVDFRNWGLVFDHGWGKLAMKLDEPNISGKKGFIAYRRARAEYLTGALCETEPAVRAYWLSWIDEMLDAGVDGIDIREENHSTHTEYPQDYGFNEVVLDECKRRGGDLLATMAQVRGEAYTEFLRQARQRIVARGKRLRYNLNVDYFGGNAPMNRRLAFPANLHWDWPRWMDEGLMDEAVLRFWSKPFDCLFEDALAQAMIARCLLRKIPVTVNRYLTYEPSPETPWTASVPDAVNPNLAYVAGNQPKNIGEFERVRADGRFAGFILYEADAFMTPTGTGGYAITNPVAREICRLARQGR
ncbi:MAG: hypothetical protein HY360_25840 [Verrucomicrobia bacterium]|nr:hypothetical protein [Verrucomicrobiota bacterium]